MGGDAQKGELKVMFDGPRVNNSYDPMRKQGAILLGNGGDNSNGSQGTFYEGAMTAAGTFPTRGDQPEGAGQRRGRQVRRAAAEPGAGVGRRDAPPGLQTFSPGSSQDTTVTFTNTTGAPATGVKLSISAPAGWTSVVADGSDTSKTFAEPVAPGASVSATFKVTSGPAAFNGDLVGNASWTAERPDAIRDDGREGAERQPGQDQRVRYGRRPTDSFIELYNAGDATSTSPAGP